MQSISGAVQLIERRIYLIRGQKVMLDFDLAELYDVPTKRLNERVSRNKKRFPKDFMFRLTQNEADVLRSQFVILSASKSNLRSHIATSSLSSHIATSSLRSHIATSKTGHGGRRYLPYVFTEQGVAMLSSVLKSGLRARAKNRSDPRVR